MSKVFYICQRHNQCTKPCSENCLYTSSFFKSRLYHQNIKPAEPIKFIKDKQGNWYQIDFNWDKNLPEAYRKKPEEYMQVPYNYLEQIEFGRILKK